MKEMKKIVYYVASSLDGFISGENGDASGFTANGEGVQQYLKDLKEFKTVIMGRKTYEFGYKFGLKPGAPAYPHMNHYIFSQTLILDNPESNVNVIRKLDLPEIEKIKEQSKSDIYLCGGGLFAGWLLENEKIDILKLKINPLILGRGIKLFGDSKKNYRLSLITSNRYDDELVINSYAIKYEK
jgi:dihydrofolate reductase